MCSCPKALDRQTDKPFIILESLKMWNKAHVSKCLLCLMPFWEFLNVNSTLSSTKRVLYTLGLCNMQIFPPLNPMKILIQVKSLCRRKEPHHFRSYMLTEDEDLVGSCAETTRTRVSNLSGPQVLQVQLAHWFGPMDWLHMLDPTHRAGPVWALHTACTLDLHMATPAPYAIYNACFL